jgi:hypothetical protein
MKLVASWHRVGRIRESAQIFPEAVAIGIADLADRGLSVPSAREGDKSMVSRWVSAVGSAALVESIAPAAEPLNGFFVLNTRRASSGPTKQSAGAQGARRRPITRHRPTRSDSSASGQR